MSAYYMIVNSTKHQFFRPWVFGDSGRPSEYLNGVHTTALALLTCVPPGGWPYVGTSDDPGLWSGDRVLAVTEGTPPDVFGIPTSSSLFPERNLYYLAIHEYEDIAWRIIRVLVDFDESYIAKFIALVVGDEPSGFPDELVLYHVGRAALSGSSGLRLALEAKLGPDWNRFYEEARNWVDEIHRTEIASWDER